MIRQILYILIFSQLLNNINLAAQEVEGFRHFTTEDGLVNDVVNSIYQDSRGNLWFCTDGGVSRYNGYEFENFTTRDGLIDDVVVLAKEDDEGRIWFAGLTSELCYFQNGRIYPYEYNDSIKSLNIPKCAKLSLVIKEKHIKVGTWKYGYYKINKEGNAELYTTPIGTSYKQEEGEYFFYSVEVESAVPSRLYINDETYPYKYPPDGGFVRIGNIKDEIYITDGVDLFVAKNDSLKFLRKETDGLYYLFQDSRDRTWCSYVMGNIRCFNHIELPKDTGRLIKTKALASMIYEDTEGGLWITTTGRGIYYQSSNDFIKPLKGRLLSLPKEKISDIILTPDKKACIILNNISIYYLNKNKSLIYTSKNQPLNQKLLLFYDVEKGELKTINYVWNIFYNDSHIQKMITAGYLGHPNIYMLDQIVDDSNSGFWLTTLTDLFHFVNNKLEKHFSSTELTCEKHDFKMRSLYFNPNSRNFLAPYNSGLYELVNGSFYDLTTSYPVFDQIINDIESLNQHAFLFGSISSGLIVMQNDSVYNISVAEGLSHNTVNTIATDEDGIIWAGTSNGLNKIDLSLDKPVVQVLTTLQGLPGNNITKVAVRDDEVWVGTTKGLAIIDRTKVQPNNIPPFMEITGVKIFEKDTVVREKYELSYKQNYLTFDYSGIAFKHNGSMKYQYILEGLEKDWQHTSNRQVKYNSLPPGFYRFKVRAINEDGAMSRIAEVSVKIRQPFWWTWWFISLEILVIATLIVIYNRWRISRVREKTRQQKELIKMELKALRAQMNPHFTFNTLNSIQQFILDNDTVSANDYLSRFAGLIRRVLQNSRHSRISLENEVETLKMYLELEQLRFSDKLAFRFYIDPDIDTHKIKISPTLLQPYIENAIVHGIMHKEGKGTIVVRFDLEKDRIKCTIMDDGVGRKQAGIIKSNGFCKDHSMGMKITQDRLDLLKMMGMKQYDVKITDLEDKEGMALGTRVELWIPYQVKGKLADHLS